MRCVLWCCFCVAHALNRAVPLTSSHATRILDEWKRQAIANDDTTRAENLRLMIQFEKLKREASGNMVGTVAVSVNDNVCAIAQLCKTPLTLVNLETSHSTQFAGTLLIQSLLETDQHVHVSEDLPPRWYIAYSYFYHGR